MTESKTEIKKEDRGVTRGIVVFLPRFYGSRSGLERVSKPRSRESWISVLGPSGYLWVLNYTCVV